MGAKKKQNVITSKEIEDMVAKHLKDAFQGDFFKTMHSMRDQQLERIKDLQQKFGDLEQFTYWDLLNKGTAANQGLQNGRNQKSSPHVQADPDNDGTDQMADQLQQQIQAFIAQVLKTNLQQDS